MNEDLHFDDEILIRYLDNELDHDQKFRIEQQLQRDDVLRQRIEDLKMAILAVKLYGTSEKVRAIHKEMTGERPAEKARVVSMKKLVQLGMGVAASVLVIFLVVKLYSSGPNADKLYNQAFVEYDASGLRGQTTATPIKKAYNEKNFSEVKRIASTGAALQQDDSLITGISFLKTNAADTSIQWLSAISPASLVKQDADFYLALAYLKNKDYSKAIDLMTMIQGNPKHVYQRQFPVDFIARVKKLNRR